MIQHYPNKYKHREGYSIQGCEIHYSSVSTEMATDQKTSLCHDHNLFWMFHHKHCPLCSWPLRWLCFAQYTFSNKFNACCDLLNLHTLRDKDVQNQL